MSFGIYLIVAATLAATIAKPQSGLDLSIAIPRTLCPTEVHYDKNEERIPRIIKTLRCKDDPDQLCAKEREPEECCHAYHPNNVVSQCVEVVDTVQVTSKDRTQTYTIRVPVGCSCMLQEETRSQDSDK